MFCHFSAEAGSWNVRPDPFGKSSHTFVCVRVFTSKIKLFITVINLFCPLYECVEGSTECLDHVSLCVFVASLCAICLMRWWDSVGCTWCIRRQKPLFFCRNQIANPIFKCESKCFEAKKRMHLELNELQYSSLANFNYTFFFTLKKISNFRHKSQINTSER